MNRILIVLLPLIWLGMVLAADRAVGNLWLLGMGLLSAGVLFWLYLRTRSVANAPDRYADERDRARRDHAHRIAYWILSAPVGGLFGFALARVEKLSQRDEPLVIEIAQFPMLMVALWGVVLLWMALPTALLAWKGEDPFDDDQL